jgi:hypothetical protein
MKQPEPIYCEYAQGHFLCILEKGHKTGHEGYYDEKCDSPEGPCHCFDIPGKMSQAEIDQQAKRNKPLRNG